MADDQVKPPENGADAKTQPPMTFDDAIDVLLKTIGSSPGETELEKAIRENAELKAQVAEMQKAKETAPAVQPATPTVPTSAPQTPTASTLEQERAALRQRETEFIKGLATDDGESKDATKFVIESLSLSKAQFDLFSRHAQATENRLAALEKANKEQGELLSQLVDRFTRSQMAITKALTAIAENTKPMELPPLPGNPTPEQTAAYRQMSGYLLGKAAMGGGAARFGQANGGQKPIDQKKLEKAVFEKKVDENTLKYIKQYNQLPPGVTLD